MKTRQKRAQILQFESGTQAQWQEFIDKNSPLLRGFILQFAQPISDELAQTCIKHGLLYTIGALESSLAPTPNPKLQSLLDSSASPSAQDSTPEFAKSPPESSAKSPMQLIPKVRSGEEISLTHGVILGDIAHGAHIHAAGNLIVFGDCAGVLRVEGEFFILRNLTSGHIVFCDAILPEPIVAKINASNHLKIIIKNSDTIAIQEII